MKHAKVGSVPLINKEGLQLVLDWPQVTAGPTDVGNMYNRFAECHIAK